MQKATLKNLFLEGNKFSGAVPTLPLGLERLSIKNEQGIKGELVLGWRVGGWVLGRATRQL